MQIKKLLIVYIFFGILVVLTGLSRFFVLSPFLATVVLCTIVFVPGFSLVRVLKLKLSGLIESLMVWMSLGWLLVLGASFLAMMAKIDINLLTTLYSSFAILLFVWALILDLFKKNRPQILCLEKIFKSSNLPLFIVLIVLALILWLISIKGVLFKGGDTLYHLSLLRKVIENQPLTIQNLAYVEGHPEIAYIFPLWHIVMGMVTKITNANMFTVYREMAFSLSIMVFLTWYWVLKLILPYKSLALITLVLFIFLNFNWDFGYIFSTLPIPHTLTQLLFLPLLVGLSIKYFFKPEAGKFYLVLIPLLSIIAACVHLTGFFYFLFIIFAIFIVFILMCFKDNDFKPIFRKMIYIFSIILGLILILGLVIQLKTQAIMLMWQQTGLEDYPAELRYTNFSSMGIFVKYAFLSLPLVFILSHNYRKLLWIFAGFVVFALVYISPLHVFFNQVLGYIFVKRLYVNVIWYWLPIGVALGFIGLFLDGLLVCFGQIWQRIIEVILVLVVILLLYFQVKYQLFIEIYNKISSDQVNTWLNQNLLLILIVLSAVAALIYVFQVFYPKFAKKFEFNDFKSPVLLSVILLLIIFIFSSVNFHDGAKILKSKNVSSLFSASIVTAERYSMNYVGGQDTIDFIKANIPPKSVFNTYGGFFYLPTVCDVHMTSYSSTADTDYSAIYKPDSEYNIEYKLSVLSQIKPDYLLINASSAKTLIIQKTLDAYPKYFQKLYNKKVVIYKVNLENVMRDAK